MIRQTSSQRSITKEVTMGLIITVILASALSFFIAYRVARTNAERHLNAKADEYIHYLKEILILPIWNYDDETIDVIGESFMQNEFIAGITIQNSRGRVYFSKKKEKTGSLVHRSARLSHFGQPMGTVDITLSSGYYNIWSRQFFWYFSFIILINLVCLIIMSGFLLRWSLNKPLALLNRIVGSYHAKKKVIPVTMPYVEFRPLISTLKGMGDEIQLRMDALQKAGKKYRSIFENATEGIFQSTPQGKIIGANPAYARILGYDTPADLMASVSDVGRQHWVDPHQRRRFLEQLNQNKVIKSFETRFRKTAGTQIWVSLNALPIYGPDNTLHHIEGLVQDITAKKKVETKLTQLSTAVEQVAESIVITDHTGRIQYVNPAFEKATGYGQADVIQRPNRFLGADDGEKEAWDDLLTTAKNGGVWTGRLTVRKKDGTPLIEDAIVSPIKSPAGRFLGYVSINRDVTLKAQYENQLRQAQKMEAIGTLAGGIAHDFNNILGVIIGCSELVRNRLAQDDKAAKDIEQVLTAGLRAKSLVSQILAFSRQEESRQIPLSLSPFIREVIRFLRATLPNYIKLNFIKETGTGTVLADPIQMQQILMNLCTNSAQAMGQNRGEIRVTLGCRRFETVGECPPGLGPGSYVMVRLEDDGPGIDPKIQDKIFDPFFTTKGVGEGTGLGLSVVHGIVKKHGGAISLASSPGQGACFCIYLPRLAHPDIRISSEQVPDLPGGSEKILLVDDETALLDIMNRILTSLGYEVEAYDRSSIALEVFTGRPGYFDLVVTDQVMAEMTGIRLTQNIRRLRPDMPVILLTGFAEVTGDKTAPPVTVVKKPLQAAELAVVIRKSLDGQKTEHPG